VECKKESEKTDNRDKWNHLKIIQKTSEQHTREAQHQGSIQNTHTEHCTSKNTKHSAQEITS
jgi:hypothetical protein